MDIWQVLTIGMRRWKLTVPLALAGIVSAWVFSASISPIYKAEGSLLYLPPAAQIVDIASVAATDPASPEFDASIDEVIKTRNPFASSIRSAVLAAELYISSRSVQVEFDELGLSTDFSVVSDSRSAVLYLSADASSGEIATRTVDRLLSMAIADLSARQAAFGVRPLEQVTAQTVTRDQLAIIDLGNRMRVRVILLILAAVFAFGAGVVVEGFAEHRSRARRDERIPDSDGSTPSGGLKPKEFSNSIGGSDSSNASHVPNNPDPPPLRAIVGHDDDPESTGFGQSLSREV